MPTVSDNAICLRRWDFSETSQTVLLLTRELGILRGLAKGAKRPKSRFSGGFDLLTRGQIVAILKTTSDLATLTEWHLEHVYEQPRTNAEANRVAFHMLDLVGLMFDDLDPHTAFYDAWIAELDKLEQCADPDACLLRFQLALLKETGYRPNFDFDAITGEELEAEAGETLAFAPRAGGVVADTGGQDRWRVRVETIDLLRSVQRETAIEKVGADHIATVRRATRLLAWYLREILGREPATMARTFPTHM